MKCGKVIEYNQNEMKIKLGTMQTYFRASDIAGLYMTNPSV